MLLVGKLRCEGSWPKCLPTAWWCKHPRDLSTPPSRRSGSGRDDNALGVSLERNNEPRRGDTKVLLKAKG